MAGAETSHELGVTNTIATGLFVPRVLALLKGGLAYGGGYAWGDCMIWHHSSQAPAFINVRVDQE